MPHDLMSKCEERREFLRDGGGREKRWKEVPVSEALDAAQGDIRCVHCHGAVRIHRQREPNGPQDHVEHRLRQDSEGCRGGIHFDGKHRLSSVPVL
jgi:hypothetical protein